MAKPKLPLKDFKWTPKLAYAVGLLVTDGNLSSDQRHIIFRSNDIDLINTFKKCLALKNRPGVSINKGKMKNTSYKLQFGDVQFYNWLLKIGLTPRKSHTIGKILVPDQYFRDFLRGHLDGDGTILFYEDRYNNYKGRTYINQRLYTEFISVSEKHIRWLYEKITSLANIKAALIKNAPQNATRVPMWVIKIAKKNSIKLLSWIYYQRNLPTLRRKRTLAMLAMATIQKEQRKLYTKIS